MYLGIPTFSCYIPTIMKRRSRSGKPVTELGQPAKRPSEYETLKENTAGSSVASKPLGAIDGTCLYWISINPDIDDSEASRRSLAA